MAGIGFALRDLARRDDLFGVARGFGHSAVVSCGPWLLTVAALAGVAAVGGRAMEPQATALFRAIVVYNFAFSMVFTAPVALIATRGVADAIHDRAPGPAATGLLLALAAAYLAALATAGPFYLGVAGIPREAAPAAIANFAVVSGLWVSTVYVSALKDYGAITAAFALGLAGGFAASVLLGARLGATGMLWGFTAGLAAVHFGVVAKVLAEYPYALDPAEPRRFLRRFREYWELAAGGLAYGVGVWIDKWILWTAPEREEIARGLVFHPTYDAAMFLAYLTTVPALAAFTLAAETGFFERYHRFRRDIQEHASLARIEEERRETASAALEGFRNIAVLQGVVTALAILLSPVVVERAGGSPLQIGTFRLGALGAYFHVLFLFATIVLTFFDLRRTTLGLHLLFLVLNGAFTYATMRGGAAFHGYGFLAAAAVSMVAAGTLVAAALDRLTYLTFVRRGAWLR